MVKMTGAQLLVDQLRIHGATRAFGVPGESYLAVLDALYDETSIDFITCRQEGGAAMMAQAHGKMTGKPGICMVTRGPGATNASAGLHVAFQDSTPMIMFIGQVARDMVEREAFQEIDYRRMFGQMAKWVAQIDDASRIPEYINRAYHTATSGRPGPVVLALPEDMLCDEVDFSQQIKTFEAPQAHAAPGAMNRLLKMFQGAQKPLMIVGGGGWSARAQADLQAFAEKSNVPIAASFRCQDYMDNRHPNYVGHVGIGIDPNLAKRVKESDLLVVLGARLGEMTTSGYTLIDIPVPAQTLVHIHAGAEEIGRVYQPDLGINASSEGFLADLKELAISHGGTWADWTKSAREDYVAFSQPLVHPGKVQMCEVMKTVRENMDDRGVVTNGAGNYAIWTHRYFPYHQFGNQFAPTCGSMGYGLPAAIAAALDDPSRDVVCMAGDGCFMMTCQELATAVQYNANLVVIVVNNGMYGTIRMHQERSYPGRVSGTKLQNPDFMALGQAMGAASFRVEETAEFEGAFKAAKAHNGPALIEIIFDPEALTPILKLSDLK